MNIKDFVIEFSAGNLYWKNEKGIYQGCNGSFARLLKLGSPKEIIGKNDFELLNDKKLAEKINKADLETINSGQEITIEEKGLDVNGGPAIYLSKKVAIQDEKGKSIGILGVSVDITDLKSTQNSLLDQIEKTQEAYRAKSQLISTTAHEIRGPVGNVCSMLKMQNDALSNLKEFFYAEILDKALPDERKALTDKFQEKCAKVSEYASIAKTEATRGLRSLSNLAELHTLQLEGVKPSYSSVEIPSLIKQAIENSKYPNDKQIEFRLNMNGNMPDVMVMDYWNIYEALRVIIGNAIRFSYPNSLIKISAEAIKGKKIQIIIEDFGPGMAENQLQNIFNPGFGKELIPEEMRYQKPSLQLPQVKMRIEASGGNIDIQSQYQCGAKVILTLPYQDIPKDAHITTDRIPPQYYLLVEDDLLTQKITRDLLEEEKHRVDVASTAEEALRFASKNTYHALLLDITLPDQNGLNVMREVLKNHPDFPIVILTSHDSEVDQEYFLSQGAANVMSKPVTLETLKNCLATVYRMQDKY